FTLNFDEYTSQFSRSPQVIEKRYYKYIVISHILTIFYTVYLILNLNCEVGILGFERRQQNRVFDRLLQILVQSCFKFRRVNIAFLARYCKYIVISHILTIFYTVYLILNLNCEVGILGFERRQQNRVFDRLLQLLVQLCFELRGGNLEIFAGCHSRKHRFRTFGDFDNLSPRLDLKIFAGCYSCKALTNS
ncbi:hypothetical protein V1477_020234, partial [Vespula maculifrons]